MKTFRANISDSVARSSKALGPMTEMLEAVDRIVNVKKPSGSHIGPSLKSDFKSILKVLLDENVLVKKDKRMHTTFPAFSGDPFLSIKKKPQPYLQFHQWLVQRRQAASIEHQLLTRVF